MHQAWSKHIFIISIVAVIFCMAQKPILARLSFSPKILFAPLSENEFAAFVIVLLLYLLKREWSYRKIYVPRPVSLWLFFLLGGYLYDRHWEGSFSFWTIPCFRQVAWSDLLLLPWGLAVAIALRSWIRGQFWFLSVVLTVLSIVLYFLPREQGLSLFGWGSIGAFIAMGSCLLVYVILSFSKAWTSPQNKPQEPYQTEPSYQSIDTDDAIVSELDDRLDFSAMAWVVHNNLEALDLRERSLRVGVIAPWGRGKSSFINLLRKRLERDGGIIIPFNPRGSKSVSSIPEDFFDSFAKELSRHYLGFGLLLARYTKHIGLLNQYEWTRPLASLLTLLLPGKEQEAVNRTLRELGKRVYVLLDDLDRLSGEEILEVLKLMDRNASFSNTVFIVAYDKAYVNNVLKKHLDHGLAHSFIDKYISWEIPLPEPDKEKLERLIRREFQMRVKDGYPGVYEEIQRGWQEVGSTVIESLNSVRDLKRYLNLVIPRYSRIFSKVDCRDYFLLYLLCYKDFGVYLALHSKRILQLDVPTKTYVLIPSYAEELKQVSQWKGSKSILKMLFAPSPEEEETYPRRPSLRNVSQFDTYFRGFNFQGSRIYGQILSEIHHSMGKRTLLTDIDDLLKKQEVGHVVDTFLDLVISPYEVRVARAEAIKAMAYMVFTGNLPEKEAEILQEELFKFLSLDRYEMYKELQVAPDLPSYKYWLNPILSFVVQVNPQWISDVIHVLNLEGSRSSDRYVYTAKELSKLLSDHQKS